MALDAKPLKISKKKAQDAKSFISQDKTKGKSTLKERQEKKYPFPDSDVASMLDELLKSKVIELPEMKRPEESGKVDDPNYCKYHRLVSHPVKKCFVLKDKIMELHSEGLIEFEEAVASSNVASITRVTPEYEALTMAIKFVKAGYDHEDVTKMANETRTIWQKKVKPSKQGLGFSPVKLKIHKKTATYITIDEVDENDESLVRSPRISAFDRLGRLIDANPTMKLRLPQYKDENYL
ncbi:hypothetical protein CCACVL1_20095 [Corchorus capsularis]|uniref:Ty3-gypsy retrotransposon protein n=1 Tax=Corchorus capsularis TaxID=210143 RepID=A0A1R3HCL9_COCAP|nr:hypothetical protein CCACVL1_20095 [Corchorus capsularis]